MVRFLSKPKLEIIYSDPFALPRSISSRHLTSALSVGYRIMLSAFKNHNLVCRNVLITNCAENGSRDLITLFFSSIRSMFVIGSGAQSSCKMQLPFSFTVLRAVVAAPGSMWESEFDTDHRSRYVREIDANQSQELIQFNLCGHTKHLSWN